MRLVVADTSPLFYLRSIDQINLLPQLFGTVFVPDAVYAELTHPTAPPALRAWAGQHPAWLQVTAVRPIDDESFRALCAGERAAITLALSMYADLILTEGRKGTRAALSKGFDDTGTSETDVHGPAAPGVSLPVGAAIRGSCAPGILRMAAMREPDRSQQMFHTP
jgi:predicted nucleic acid-binding protein